MIRLIGIETYLSGAAGGLFGHEEALHFGATGLFVNWEFHRVSGKVVVKQGQESECPYGGVKEGESEGKSQSYLSCCESFDPLPGE